MTIKTIIFDLGRVLVDIDMTSFNNFFANLNSNNSDDKLQKIMSHELMRQWGRGEINPSEFHQHLCQRFDLKLAFEEFRQNWCDIFREMPGMEQLVAELAEKYPLGLLSDTDPLHWNFVKENYPILLHFKKPALSFEIHVTKPDRQAFLTAAKMNNTPPENCLFIDDLQKNIEGAQSAGLQAIQFKDAKKLRQTLKEKYGIIEI